MKKKKIVLGNPIIIILIILLVIVAIIYFNNKPKDNQNTIASTTPIEEKSKEIDEDILRNIKLVDQTKDVVYTLTKIKTYEFPVINIDTPDVKLINSEIKEHYGFTSEASLTGLSEISYDYYINKNILSLVVKKGGNQSVYANSYNINLEDGGNKITGKKMISDQEQNEDEIKKEILKAVEEEYKKVVKVDRSLSFGTYWDSMKYADEIEKSIQEYTTKVNNLNNMYLNENNELCMIVSFVHPGGEWMCTRTVIVNISNNYQVEELKLNNGEGSNNTEETANKLTSQSLEQYEIEMIEPDPLAYPSTPDSITQERAIELAKSVFGTKSEETGYEIVYTYYAWAKDQEGKEYYIINMHWNTGDAMQWVAAVCVSVDGSNYKQLGKQPTFQNGDTIEDLLDGGEFNQNQ